MRDFGELERALDGCDAAGPATDDLIAAAENELGVTFPPSYRRFLAIYGAVACRGFLIAGLFQDEPNDQPPLWLNVLRYTGQLRRSSRGLIPRAYVALSDDGGDYKFYLDTSRVNDAGECPVVVLGPGADDLRVADDFVDFVVKSAEESISF